MVATHNAGPRDGIPFSLTGYILSLCGLHGQGGLKKIFHKPAKPRRPTAVLPPGLRRSLRGVDNQQTVSEPLDSSDSIIPAEIGEQFGSAFALRRAGQFFLL
jgi:hypothetical protein